MGQWFPSYGPSDCLCVNEKKVYQHPLFSLYECTYRIKKFSQSWCDPFIYTVLKVPDSVVILCHDNARDCFVMVEQCRPVFASLHPGESPWLIESPAGYIEAGEEPKEALRREVLEETGCQVKEIKLIAQYGSYGVTSSRVYAYYATVDSSSAKKHSGNNKEGEDIRVHLLTYAQLSELVKQGRICTSHALLLYYWYTAQKCMDTE